MRPHNLWGILMKAVALALMVAILSLSQAKAQSISAPSTWVNQRGSVLKIDAYDAAKRTITGSYYNHAPGFKCQGEPPFPLAGNVRGNRIRFSVAWKDATRDCNSRTDWRGVFNDRLITTKWLLYYTDASTGKPAIMRGRDQFSRTY